MEFILDSIIEALVSLKGTWQIFSSIWFIILPVPFYYLFKTLWLEFIQREFVRKQSHVLLEVIPPRDIEKSPQPMESVFSGMAGVLKSFHPIEEFVDGALTPKFGLEIASFEGAVHFYIRAPRPFRDLVESHLYAQYPNAEIVEVPDYVDNAPRLLPNEKWDIWGTDFELVKPDPYPIKTYKFFEETISGEMIDPLASVVEVMSNLKPGQQMWFQLIVIPEKETWYSTGKILIDEFTGKAKKRKGVFSNMWKDITDVLSNLPKAITEPVIEFEHVEEKSDDRPIEFRLTPGEKEVLKALESNVGKYVFRTKMRFLYLGTKENFSKANVSSFVGAIKQFADFNLNSLKPNDRSKTFANFIFVKSRTLWRQRKIFQRYKDRDPDGLKFFLSTEELATVFHMPDISVVAPGVTKTDFKRSGAPFNLPIK